MRILDRPTLRAQIARWATDRKFGFDVETNGRHAWEPGGRIVGVSLAGLDAHLGLPTALYVPLAHRRGPNADPAILGDLIAFAAAPRPLVVYSAAFEAMWVAAKWKQRVLCVGDGYIAARLLGLAEHSLKDLAPVILQRPMRRLDEILPKGCVDFSEADTEDPRTTAYAEDDALAGWQVEGALYTRLVGERLLHLYQLELRAAVVMAEQTLDGYVVDAEILREQMDEEEASAAALTTHIFAALRTKPFNLNSAAQLGAALQSAGVTSTTKTATGNPSWSLDALEAIKHAHPVIPSLIDFKASNALVTALRKYPASAETDGRLHPRWQSIGILGSARMYAEKPPLTALPFRARRALPAPAACVWVHMAWDHPELRFTAALAQDVTLAACLRAPDVYDALRRATAIETDDHTLDAFLLEFICAAGQANGEYADWSDRARHAFPNVVRYLTTIVQEARQSHTVTSWMGRRWRIDAPSPEALARRACVAVGQQSTGTALKAALCLLIAHREMGTAVLRGVRQILPLFDTVSYCLPAAVPIEAHCELVSRFFALDVGPVGGAPLGLVGRFYTGPTLGDLEEVA